MGIRSPISESFGGLLKFYRGNWCFMCLLGNPALFLCYWSRRKEKKKTSYLEVFEEDTVSCPVHLCEQRLVDDFAHQFEHVHLALVVRLVLEKTKEIALPLLVVRHRELEFPDQQGQLPAAQVPSVPARPSTADQRRERGRGRWFRTGTTCVWRRGR